jgi:hypothetical protein
MRFDKLTANGVLQRSRLREGMQPLVRPPDEPGRGCMGWVERSEPVGKCALNWDLAHPLPLP